MATLSDLPTVARTFLKFYRFRSVDWGSGARFRVPLAEARVAVVTTAGFYLPDQPAFVLGVCGDASWRELPHDVNLKALRIGHVSHEFDREAVARDPNVALPLDRLRELSVDGIIGGLNHRHFSFMGGIPMPDRLVRETAPQVADLLAQDRVDCVVLTPV